MTLDYHKMKEFVKTPDGEKKAFAQVVRLFDPSSTDCSDCRYNRLWIDHVDYGDTTIPVKSHECALGNKDDDSPLRCVALQNWLDLLDDNEMKAFMEGDSADD